MKFKLKADKVLHKVAPAIFPERIEENVAQSVPNTVELRARNKDLLVAIADVGSMTSLASGLAAVFRNGPLETTDIHVNEALSKCLWRMASLDRPDIVRDLLARGADVKANSGMALQLAMRYGTDDVVLALLEGGANIHFDSDAPLRRAVVKGQVDFVHRLLELGADVHANADQPLRDAVAAGRLDIVATLLKKGADVHVNEDEPLREAVKIGLLDIAVALLDTGANISAIVLDAGAARTWEGPILQTNLLVLERSGDNVPNEIQTALTRSCLQGASMRGNLQDAEAILLAIRAMKLDSREIAKAALSPARSACTSPIAKIREGGEKILQLLVDIISPTF